MLKKQPSIMTVTLNPSYDVTLWLPTLSEDIVNRIEKEKKEAAGTGVNIALALKNFGHNVRAAGLAGEENLPPFIEHLRMNGIPANFVPMHGAIRENISIRVGEKTIKINRKGPACSVRDIMDLRSRIERFTVSGDIIIFGGSMPPGMTSQDYCELIEYASNLNLRVVVDSDVLSGQQLIDIRPWMIKPNEFELEMITGRKLPNVGEILREAARLCKSGVENVIVSMGAKGLLAVTDGTAVKVSVPVIDVKSAVGAGDSTLAGFISAYLGGKDFEACAAHAAACGTAAAMCDATGVANPCEVAGCIERIQTEIVEIE